MASNGRSRRVVRTMLGEILRERGQTAESFSEAAERFARENGLKATLSARHVQRLAAGRNSGGRPLGPLRPTTQLLLETMLNRPVAELLGPSSGDHSPCPPQTDDAAELRASIASSRRVDAGVVRLLQQQLDAVRQVDRRLGAAHVLDQLRQQIRQIAALLSYSLTPEVRRSLAAILVDASTLAGWQSMDQGQLVQAWGHYEQARDYARASESVALSAYAAAAQAVMLLDVDYNTGAAQLLESASLERRRIPGALLAWLYGAAGEVHAANGQYSDSMRAFDSACRALESGADELWPAFVLLDATHLARWEGSALVRLRRESAVAVLTGALQRLDPTFTRAAISLRLDLAQALSDCGDREAAATHATCARGLAIETGSVRLKIRGDRIVAGLAER